MLPQVDHKIKSWRKARNPVSKSITRTFFSWDEMAAFIVTLLKTPSDPRMSRMSIRREGRAKKSWFLFSGVHEA